MKNVYFKDKADILYYGSGLALLERHLGRKLLLIDLDVNQVIANEITESTSLKTYSNYSNLTIINYQTQYGSTDINFVAKEILELLSHIKDMGERHVIIGDAQRFDEELLKYIAELSYNITLCFKLEGGGGDW